MPPHHPRTEPTTTWRREEIAQLVNWMEQNAAQLRGKQKVWHRLVKEQIFADQDHINVKRIRDKVTNMKRQWKEAGDMRKGFGWANRKEENEKSVNDRLEKKCQHFWRLEAIWGSMPPKQKAKDSRVAPATADHRHPVPLAPRLVASARTLRRRNPEPDVPVPVPDLDTSLEPEIQPSPSEANSPAPQDPHDANLGASGEDNRLVPSPTATPDPGPATGVAYRGPGGGNATLMQGIKRMLEETEDVRRKREERKWQMEMEMRREELEAKKEMLRDEIAAKTKSEERIAEIHAASQERIAQMQLQFLQSIVLSLRPPQQQV